MHEIYYTRTDGYPICYGCINFRENLNCYLNDSGTSSYPTSCKYFSNNNRQKNLSVYADTCLKVHIFPRKMSNILKSQNEIHMEYEYCERMKKMATSVNSKIISLKL